MNIHLCFVHSFGFFQNWQGLGGGIRSEIIFMKIQLVHSYEDLVNIDNLLSAWEEFLKGKRHKKDVQQFQFNLMANILSLNHELSSKRYRHGKYEEFSISDTKPRTIHKASVRDRLLHHAVYRILYPFFDKMFIADSFSCRIDKGTHKAIERFREYGYIVSKNNTKTCWVLKCDVKKFFASIDQKVLLNILDNRIPDKNIVGLLKEIIDSFNSERKGIGLPLGNLTSQLFSNIYMNEFDQFVKHSLKVKHYIRYADDFVILSQNKKYLEKLVLLLQNFLDDKLKLTIHSNKIFIKTLSSGVDFLGWVHFLHHRVLRTKTKQRMFKRLKETQASETINSYLGILKHGNTYKIKTRIFIAEK